MNYFKNRTIHSNIHEGQVNHEKNYIGFIELDGKEFLVDYVCKFRIQAQNYFQQVAAYNGGKFVRLGVIK